MKIIIHTDTGLHLINQVQVNAFFEQEKPDQLYLAAAKVGGIYANDTFPAEFIYQNLMIEANVIPSLIRCFNEAKINTATNFTIWGKGKPKCEFFTLMTWLVSVRTLGSPRKLIDIRRLKSLEWQPEVSLKERLTKAYVDFVG